MLSMSSLPISKKGPLFYKIERLNLRMVESRDKDTKNV